MAKRELAQHVTIGGETYRPGDDVPEHVAEKITNPAVWAKPQDEAAADAEQAPRQAGTPSGRRLAGHVTVGGETYSPDDHLPDHVAEKITNPGVWAKPQDEAAPEEPQPGEDGGDPGGQPGKAVGRPRKATAKES